MKTKNINFLISENLDESIAVPNASLGCEGLDNALELAKILIKNGCEVIIKYEDSDIYLVEGQYTIDNDESGLEAHWIYNENWEHYLCSLSDGKSHENR